jgi:uncharacterized protein YkwD
VSSGIHNYGSSLSQYLFLFEIRDSSDVTIYLRFVNETINDYQTVTSNLFWTPSSPDEYQIRVFAISNLTKPEILTGVSSVTVDVKDNNNGKNNAKELVSNQLTADSSKHSSISQFLVQEQSDIQHLKQYALQLINSDRQRYGIPPLKLSQNIAAQKHAEDMYMMASNASHWTSDGMKPYMRYTIFNGTGAVAQNVAAGYIYSRHDLQQCLRGLLRCLTLNATEMLDNIEYAMMYEDRKCCNDGHRNNILDKYHTNVSIGIAYDKYYIAFVQNFENNYINFQSPIREEIGKIKMVGSVIGNKGNPREIGVYYDVYPTFQVYQRDKNRTSYDDGRNVAYIVKPAPFGYNYPTETNYTLIQADKWTMSNSSSFDIEFNLEPVIKASGSGVYTLVMYLESKDNDNLIPATTYSIFKKQ